jgi:xanthine dehydrogenase accessory factor
MPESIEKIRDFLATSTTAILVEIASTKGSTPRETDAFMLVSAHESVGTIGGGQLEFIAIDHARAILSGADRPKTLDIPLGPEIGQCCGGRVQLSFRRMDQGKREAILTRLAAAESAFPEIVLFGAGHVGLALACALRPLPLRVMVVETRTEALAGLPDGIDARRVAMPETAIDTIAPGGAVVILTHDHALDFMIALAALKRQDLAYVGMIGSATKRATFKSWLRREADSTNLLERLTLPIGGTLVKDKRPEVIAALVAAELVQTLLK